MLGAARGAYGWCVWLARYEVQVRLVVARYEVQVRLVVRMGGAVRGAGTTGGAHAWCGTGSRYDRMLGAICGVVWCEL